jgi:hypothetical protein
MKAFLQNFAKFYCAHRLNSPFRQYQKRYAQLSALKEKYISLGGDKAPFLEASKLVGRMGR